MDCSVDGCVQVAYSMGLCSKHYSEKKRAEAPVCKITGCISASARCGMCNSHYRQQLRSKSKLCNVSGCGRNSHAKGYCSTHLQRIKRHGNLDVDKRAHDRGTRTRHPLYQSWRWAIRNNIACAVWRNDFWSMVTDIADRPSPRHWLRRMDKGEPLGPGNWIWSETVATDDKNAYAREWRRRNHAKVKNSDLKKRFGISLETYHLLLDAQNGVCAICRNLEAARKPGQLTARELAVDHDHVTGNIRGLICSTCNLLIGKYEANPHLIEGLVSYMRRYERKP